MRCAAANTRAIMLPPGLTLPMQRRRPIVGDTSGRIISPPNAGKVRPKGASNAANRSLREMILGALEDAGGQDYLAEHAHKNPAAFLGLVGRVLPREPAVEPAKNITLNFGRELKPRQPAIEDGSLRSAGTAGGIPPQGLDPYGTRTATNAIRIAAGHRSGAVGSREIR